MKKVGIIQSSYIPWKGYFDIIHDVDLFVYLDDVQFTARDWRNRNRIKTSQGARWLTIPVGEKIHRLIHEVPINDKHWNRKHWASIQQSYSKTPYFKNYKDFFEYVYMDRQWENLSEFNQFLTTKISQDFLGIKTEFKDSREYNSRGEKLERLLDLLIKIDVDYYVSGPSAREYIVEERLTEIGVELHYKDYSGYPEYPQLFPPFEHAVSILDLLFNCGPDAPYYIWGWREERKLELEVEKSRS
ncbi:MAG: WbqC family protein [Marinirhabdus sp.]|nr:WbqC family protein [Marinirhabdus sp.]